MREPKFPTPTPEGEAKVEIGKERVLDALRTRGLEDPGTRELVASWTKQQEALARQQNTAEAAISFNIERSELYIAVGDIEGALECLDDARLHAHSEGKQDLYDRIMRRMDELEGR